MQTTTKSVKSSATAFIESLGETVTTPFDIIAAMEEAFMKRPMFTPVHRNTTREQIMESVETVLSPMDEFVANRILASARWKQKVMVFTNFGRWLEDDEKRIMNNAKEGLESVEDRLAAACYACDKIKSRKLWKLEQKRNEAASHNGEPLKARKVVIDGKASWNDAQVHELPPTTRGKAHEQAYYAIKLPSGTIINLGQTQVREKGQMHNRIKIKRNDVTRIAKLNKLWEKRGTNKIAYTPIKKQYQSQALQTIATRLGIEMRGGDTAILNHLLGEEPLVSVNDKGETETNWKWLPSYTSVWQGTWIVYVGWRLNPKVAPSSYWVDDNGDLTQFNPNYQMTPEDEGYQAPLTLSQLDYHLLSESSDLAVENENGEVVEFMNEEEEFLTFAPQRESGETFIDFSKYCEDDAEMELFQACSGVVERSEGGITLGDLESSQFIDGYIHKGIIRTERTLRKMREIEDPNAKTLEIIDSMEKNLARLNRLDELWNKFVGNSKTDHLVQYWYPNNVNRMLCMSKANHAKMIPAIIPGASDEPRNLIAAPLAREVDVMPEHATVTYSWLDALSPKLMAKRELEARRGQVFKAVKDGTLKAQLAFSSAFEEALRAG